MPTRPEERRSYTKHVQEQLQNLGIQERFRRDSEQSTKNAVNVTVQMPEISQAQENKNKELEVKSQTNWKLLIAAIIVAAYFTVGAISGAIYGVEAGVPTMLLHAALQGNFTPIENVLTSLPVVLSAAVGVYDTLLGSYIVHKLRRDV